ncbi:MAG TPA: lipopolysaccharide heptosyltransferase II, partial [Candidatus Accumulibacter sp.]|nr:lipopolysaccharide heptosyltransferase II [Accumulibacter sp.]
VVVVAPSWIGDSVLAQPLFIRLHERIPGLQLDALVPRWVAPVLERMPEIHRIIDSPFAHGDLSLRTRHRIARELARGGYQRAYVLPNSLKSALIPFFADIPERIGFIGETRYGLINRRHTLDKKRLPQMAERFAQLAEPPGAPLPRPLPRPRLRASPAQRIEALAALGVSLPAKLAVFCPGAEYGPAKRWPARHFAALAAALAQHGHAVWLLGSAKDRPVGEEILDHAPPGSLPLNLCGATTLAQAIDLISAASLVVCNDSGLMHVAAALDRHVVAVYGSSSPDFTPPLSEKATIISLNLACSPCFERQCPLDHLNCLQQLEPQRVLAACLRGVAT